MVELNDNLVAEKITIDQRVSRCFINLFVPWLHLLKQMNMKESCLQKWNELLSRPKNQLVHQKLSNANNGGKKS